MKTYTVFANIAIIEFKGTPSSNTELKTMEKYENRNDTPLYNKEGIIGKLYQKIGVNYDTKNHTHRSVFRLNIELTNLNLDILSEAFIVKTGLLIYPIGQTIVTTIAWSNNKELIGKDLTYSILENNIIQIDLPAEVYNC
jgi:hypothetical protein